MLLLKLKQTNSIPSLVYALIALSGSWYDILDKLEFGVDEKQEVSVFSNSKRIEHIQYFKSFTHAQLYLQQK